MSKIGETFLTRRRGATLTRAAADKRWSCYVRVGPGEYRTSILGFANGLLCRLTGRVVAALVEYADPGVGTIIGWRFVPLRECEKDQDATWLITLTVPREDAS